MGAELDVRLLAVGVGGGRLAVHARRARAPAPQSISTRLVRVKRCWPRAASSVTACPEWATASPAAARLMPSWQSSSPAGSLGHAGHVAPVGEPGADLQRVVDPSDVVRRPVSCFYRLGQDATLFRAEKAKSDIHLATSSAPRPPSSTWEST